MKNKKMTKTLSKKSSKQQNEYWSNFFNITANYFLKDLVMHYRYTNAYLKGPSRNLKTRIAALPRCLINLINKDFGVRLLGGETLVVLAAAAKSDWWNEGCNNIWKNTEHHIKNYRKSSNDGLVKSQIKTITLVFITYLDKWILIREK